MTQCDFCKNEIHSGGQQFPDGKAICLNCQWSRLLKLQFFYENVKATTKCHTLSNKPVDWSYLDNLLTLVNKFWRREN